jgi:hypothetical protein
MTGSAPKVAVPDDRHGAAPNDLEPIFTAYG